MELTVGTIAGALLIVSFIVAAMRSDWSATNFALWAIGVAYVGGNFL